MADYICVSQCFHCQWFGHIAKHCSMKPGEHFCVHCGGKGHLVGDCKRAALPPNCVNCWSLRLQAKGHRAGDKNCPAFTPAVGRLVARMEYASSDGGKAAK